MDLVARILDILRDTPTGAVGGGIAVVVLLIAWLLARALFRSKSPAAATGPAPLSPAKRPAAEPEQPAPGQSALDGFRRWLESKGVPAADRDVLVREYAAQLNDARTRLGEIADIDHALAERLSSVRNALDTGALEDAMGALDRLGTERTASGRELRAEAERQLTAAALTRLVAGDLALAARDSEAAERHFRMAIESLPPAADSLLAECLNKHGTAAYRANRLDLATMSFRRAVKLLERLKGDNDGDVATALNNLAMLYYARGDLNAAEPLYRRALAIDEAGEGGESAAVATDLNNLALLLKQENRSDEAEPLLKRALAIKEKALEPGHPSLITGLRNYATVLRSLGRETEAESFEKRADALSPESAPFPEDDTAMRPDDVAAPGRVAR